MSDTEGVGYKRPPQHTRWKKGQSGNPRAKRKPKRGKVEVIDSLLQKKVKTNGTHEPEFMTTLQGIILHLWVKAAAGDKRAAAVLFSYQQLDLPDDSERQIIVRGGLPDRNSGT